MKKVAHFLVFLALGIFIIWWFQRDLSTTEKAEIWVSFKGIDYLILSISICTGLLSHLLRALRWNLLLETMHYKPPIRLSFMAVMIGYFANLAVPRMGELLRCGILQRYAKIPIEKSFGTVVTERIIDMVLFFLVFGLALLLEFGYLKEYVMAKLSEGADTRGEMLHLLLYIGVACLVLSLGIYWIYRKYKQKIHAHPLFIKLASLLLGFWEGIMSLKNLKKPYIFILYSIGIWFFYWLTLYLVFLAMPNLGNISGSVVLACLAMGTFGYMVTPGGIGLYPVIISETFGVFGLSKVLGYAAAWLGWTAQTVMFIIIGLASLLALPLLYKNADKKTHITKRN